MGKTCNICGELYETITPSGVKYKYNICKKCRSRKQVAYVRDNPEVHENRKKYMRAYIRKVGIVKEYPCEYCGKYCYKKYAKAFCSDKCRFMSYVKKTKKCWLWTGTKNRRGYGKFCFREKKTAIASRVSYILFKGDIPDNYLICHTCDNPSCVNPEHLWAGTTRDNAVDRISKKRFVGDEHPLSRLDAEKVIQMRKLANSGKYKQKVLAKMFGITAGHVNNIIHNRSWKHIS